MRTETVTDSATLKPSGYDDVSTYSTNSIANGYTASSSTGYATIYLTRGSGAETIFYYTFADPAIPSNATIISISCSVKVYNNTGSSYVATKTVQLCTGTTTKGSASNIPSSTTAFDMTCGSWTVSELSDIRLKLYAQRTSTNQNTSYYIRFYGATLTINYSVINTYYTVSVSSTATAVTASPLGSTEYLAGEKTVLAIDGDINKCRVKCDGVIINDSLVLSDRTLVAAAHTVSYSGYPYGSSWTYAQAALDRHANTTLDNGVCNSQSGTTTYTYSFPASSEPVKDLYVEVLCKNESSVLIAENEFTLRLFNGSTAVSSLLFRPAPTKSVVRLDLNSGVSAADVFPNLNLKVQTGEYGGTIYGITAYITIDTDNYYTYTPMLSSDHTITVEDYILFLKWFGGWWNVAKVWKKTNGTWSVDWGYTFSQTTKYLHAESLAYDSEVEYLECTGTQYIDTGIIPDADTGIHIKVSCSNTNDTYIIGLRDTSGNTRWCIGHSNGAKFYYGYGAYATGGNTFSDMTAVCNMNYLNSGKFEVIDIYDDTHLSVELPTLGFTPERNIRLFGADYYTTSAVSSFSGKIYEVTITQGTDVIRDFIPVRIGNEGFLYDKINGVLYRNVGTGSFTLGNDVVRTNPYYDAEVTYIRSHGTEYIDTGYIPTVDTHIIMRAAYKGTYSTTVDLQNGSMKSSTNLRFHWGIISNSNGTAFAYYFACGSKYASTVESLDANAHIFELWGNGQFKIDSRTSTVGTDASDTSDDLGTTDKSITLFARNDANSVGEFIDNMELYYFQIYESDVLMMDFIPVRVGVTSYLYDKVGKRLYGNLGTGYLTHGDDIAL